MYRTTIASTVSQSVMLHILTTIAYHVTTPTPTVNHLDKLHDPANLLVLTFFLYNGELAKNYLITFGSMPINEQVATMPANLNEYTPTK